MKLSVCIPVYNGAATIGKLVETVKRELSFYDLEIVMVNDCSKDNSEEVCTKIATENENVKFISLRKNSGEHNAVMCALNYATGDYAAIIDDDFQNPPSEIIKLVEEAKKGFDVVYSKYKVKKHNIFRNLGSYFNDIVATSLLNKPKKLYLSSFKVINKDIINEVIKYKGPFPYIDGLILRVTGNISSIYVEHNKREDGKSNYTIAKLFSLWLNMFVNFSIKPLRLVLFLGIALSLACACLGIYFVVDKIINPETSQGWASIIVSILFTGGVQMIFLGIIGEYLGKQYLDSNGTPQWTVKKEIL